MPYLQATNIKLINLKWHSNTKHNKKTTKKLKSISLHFFYNDRNDSIDSCNKMKLKLLDSDSFHTCKH